MNEIGPLLCGLAFLLLLVTVVGHGLWVASAWLLRQMSGEQPADPGQPCSQCGARLGVRQGRCVVCGAVPGVGTSAKVRDELTTTARQLRRLLDRGAITAQQYGEIIAAVQSELDKLAQPVAARPTIPSLAPRSADQRQPAAAPPALSPPANDMVIDAELVEVPPTAPIPPPAVAATQARPLAVPPPAAVHPLDRPLVQPPPTPAPPRRNLAEVVQNFMEESNIRWMEIIAAVCIVISSVGLVWSLRNTLRAIPYVPAALFMLFTLAFHGAGLYTLRKWKLHAVSRVILVIAQLLVPLSFTGAIVMSGSGNSLRPVGDPWFLTALAIGVGVFGWVCYSGSRELVGRGAWPLAIGVLGCSASQVLIHRQALAGLDFWRLSAIAAIPLASYLVATVGQLVRARRWPQLSLRRVQDILHVLGIATFALAAPLALIIVRSGPQWTAVARLSPALSLSAAAVLALGLLIHRRTTARSLAAYQTAGTAILICGGLALLMLVAFTWPEPELLLAVGAINCVILAALGVLAELPLLYAPAAACAALAATIGVHLVGGQFADREHLSQKVVQALLMGRTSLVLGGLGLAIAAAGGWCLRHRRHEDALMLLASTTGLAAAAVLISLFSGFVSIPGWPQDRELAAAILLAYSAALLAAGPWTKWPHVAATGSFLLWTALVQACAVNATVRTALAGFALLQARPVLLATIGHGVLTAALAAVAEFTRIRISSASPNSGELGYSHSIAQLLREPLAIGAAISLAIATPFLFWIRGGDFNSCAWLAAVAAAGWLLLALAQRWPWAISALQGMAALAPAQYVAGLWRAQIPGEDWWLAKEHLLAQVTLAAVAAIVWGTIRRLTSDREPLRKLLNADWPAVDQVLLGIAAFALPAVAMMACTPHAGWELGFEQAPPPSLFKSAGDLIGPLPRGWLALAVVLTALAVALWERVSFHAAAGIGIAAYAAVWLGAGHFETVSGVASAARWCAAIYTAVFAAAFLGRDQLRVAAKQLTWLRWSKIPAEASAWFGAQPLLFGGLTILGITIVAVSQHARGVALHEPAQNSVFAAMGLTASYAGPLLALVAVLLAYAVRERQAAFALGGAGVFQLAVNLAFVIYVSTYRPPELIRNVQWLQWNAVAAGLYSLVWLGLWRWITPQSSSEFVKKVALLQWLAPLGVAAVAVVVLSGWAAMALIANPGGTAAELAPLGHWLSYAALGLLLAAAVWGLVLAQDGVIGQLPGIGDASAWLAAIAIPVLAATLGRFDTSGQWIAFHTLEVGWLAVAAAACGVVCVHAATQDARLGKCTPQHFSAALIAGLVVFLAIRGNDTDPAQPWWSLGCVLGCSGIATALGLARRSQPYAFAMASLAGLAVMLFWNAPATWPWIQAVVAPGDHDVLLGWEVFSLALIAAAAFWLWRETATQQRHNQSLDTLPFMPRLHAAVACGLVPLTFLVRLAYGMIEWRSLFDGYDVAAAAVILALGGLLLASLWDRRALWAMPLAYLWGLAAWCLAIGMGRLWLPQPGPRLAAMALGVTAHVALTGQLWSYGANLAAWGARLGVSDPIGGLSRTARWLPVVNLLLVAGVCLADLALVLNLTKLEFRVASALGPALAAWGVLCLAQERRRDALQLTSLLVAAFSAVLLGWAQLYGHTPDVWMERVFRLLMVLAALTFAYGLVLPRFLLTSGSWHAATRKAGYIAACAALLTFAATLAMEVSLFVPGRGAPVRDVQVVAVAVVLVGLIAGLVSMALLKGRDPLLLTDTLKQGYVYAAQAVTALLFAHLYVCKPLWFDTVLRPYWPFIVMGLAFLGVGAAELFHRMKVRVLAEPLERTGALLPLLPVLGWWAGSQVDYSLLLLIVGILYLVLSFTRKSWAAMIAAAVAGNGALWSLFNSKHFEFVEHPQLWLIPPALSALAAAQVNRRRLPPDALTAIRYAATIVIYVSSTSEILIKGLGTDLRPPMILLGLSVAGALTGIALQVRAFLYLGTSFTLLALTSMVWHASRSIEHVWPLWAFGIFLGVGILLLLVLFEKNKTEMRQLVARLRQWEQ